MFSGEQVVYEEGGTIRGYGVHIKDGDFYIWCLE